MSTPISKDELVVLSAESLHRALAVRDLTDPAAGPHAMQVLLQRLQDVLVRAWGCAVVVHRAHPLVGVGDNYDRLGYAPDAVTRDVRYTRYASERTLLRTHTTAMIPPLLERLGRLSDPPQDVLLICPGLVYRRDSIDRLHTGTPHQVDLWRVRRGRLGSDDLREMIGLVIGTALPGVEQREVPALHPYTVDGRQVDVRTGDQWVEVLECGLASPVLLAGCGLAPSAWSGLAMGIGLDRLLMLAKGVEDIRLLRAVDPRVASQMLDLAPYRAVSREPPVRRDLSIAVAAGTDVEEIGDRVREAIGSDVDSIEAVEVVSETPHDALSETARRRIGLRQGQKNVLVRVVLRHPTRTLTSHDANVLRDRVYEVLHEGTTGQWAARPGGDEER